MHSYHKYKLWFATILINAYYIVEDLDTFAENEVEWAGKADTLGRYKSPASRNNIQTTYFVLRQREPGLPSRGRLISAPAVPHIGDNEDKPHQGHTILKEMSPLAYVLNPPFHAHSATQIQHRVDLFKMGHSRVKSWLNN